MEAKRKAVFGTVEVYEQMAELLNADPVWVDKGKKMDYSMIYEYGPPVDRCFFIRFDKGRVTDVREIASKDAEPADFVVSGATENWRALLEKRVSPMSAMTRGLLKIDGKATTVMKNIDAFTYVIEVMRNIELVEES